MLISLTVAILLIGLMLYWWLSKRRSRSIVLANSREGSRQFAAGPTPPNRVPEIMMVIVSLLVLGSALFIILSNRYDLGSQKWAYGAVGSIIGFWLKPSR